MRRSLLSLFAVAVTLVGPASAAPADAGGPGARLADAASSLAQQRLPYVDHALGGPEGPEHPSLPQEGLDCVTFLEASLLRAGGVEDRAAQDHWLRETRYDDRDPAYCTRLHYVSDWVSRNTARGWLEEVTAEVAHDGRIPLEQRGWTRGWMAAHDQDPAQCVGSADDRASLAYIGPKGYDRLAQRLRAGDILLFVASAPGLDTAHLGIVEANGGLAMASSIEHRTLVKTDWRAYARKRASRFAGVRVLRVRELPTATP